MDETTADRYEAPALVEIGGFVTKTRWVGGGRIPDLILTYIIDA
ncbi:lasso RiPP family leader peptide-containing protein [Kibdelosporangium persicum]|nr:lasso RiPP family leader peptide-containing protein [Kibdelosporangium persicum]